MSTRDYYDDFAATYEDGRDRGYHRLIDDLEAGLVLPHVRGRDVLEVGCGTGLILARIAPHAGTARGIDLSPGMLAVARNRDLDVVEGSATALPFADASFDVVYSFKVLAHVVEIETALAEVARVLRPGGIALLEFYNRRSLRYVARILAGRRKIGRAHDEGDIATRWDTTSELRAILPANLALTRFVGVRIATPAAKLHALPLIGSALGRLEARLTRSPLTRLGGFLVVEAVRR